MGEESNPLRTGPVRRVAGKAWARIARRVAICGVVVPLIGACAQPDNAISRGDRLWADSSYEKALAEYRLGISEGADDLSVYLRVAHAYAQLGKIGEARDSYKEVLERAPRYADQAVFDYLALARAALDRGDRHGVAQGVEAALALQPALPVDEFAPTLARYYSDMGEPERALRFYERALANAPADSVPGLYFQLGSIYAGRGDCRSALGYFEAARSRASGSAKGEEARWRMGECAFEVAREARKRGQITDALTHLELVLELQAPSNLMDQAWFEHGEVLFALGRFDAAQESYRKVLELNRTRGGRLVDRARERIDQIRFGT